MPRDNENFKRWKREWYRKHREEVLARQRERYKSDIVYRERMLSKQKIFNSNPDIRARNAENSRRRYVPHPRLKKTAEEIEVSQKARAKRKYEKHMANTEWRAKINAKQAARQRRLRADPIKGPILKAAALIRLNKWRAEHPEKVREMNKMVKLRRSKKTTGTINVSYWFATLAAFNNKCAVCGDGEHGLHRDHWIPISTGGKHENRNMIPLCPKCNRSKSNHEPYAWLVMKEHGLATLARIETVRRRLARAAT